MAFKYFMHRHSFLRVFGCLMGLCMLGGTPARTQNVSSDSISAQVAELNRLFSKIYTCPPDFRWNASDSFQSAAKSVLEAYENTAFPFERIKSLNYFKAEDNSFRMLNWGIPDEDGTVSYKALLQVKRTSKKDYVLYEMSDMSLYQPYPEQISCSPQTWWGAFYYACIEKKAGNRSYYTFLGWNAGQKLYQQSVIEVMSIKPNGEVQFGASLFSNRGRIPGSDKTDRSRKDSDIKRVVFRFGKKTGMILRYDYQSYRAASNNAKKGERKANMIIFDRLVPEQMSMADDYAYYIPEGGVYQAYVWENNRWRLETDVIARNPDPHKKRKKPMVERRFFTD